MMIIKVDFNDISCLIAKYVFRRSIITVITISWESAIKLVKKSFAYCWNINVSVECYIWITNKLSLYWENGFLLLPKQCFCFGLYVSFSRVANAKKMVVWFNLSGGSLMGMNGKAKKFYMNILNWCRQYFLC